MFSFVNFAVEHSPNHSGTSNVRAQELVAFSSAETEASSSTEIDHISSSRNHLTSIELSNTSTSTLPRMLGQITRASSGDPLQNASALVESNDTGQIGVSIFQGYYLSSQSKCIFCFLDKPSKTSFVKIKRQNCYNVSFLSIYHSICISAHLSLK